MPWPRAPTTTSEFPELPFLRSWQKGSSTQFSFCVYASCLSRETVSSLGRPAQMSPPLVVGPQHCWLLLTFQGSWCPALTPGGLLDHQMGFGCLLGSPTASQPTLCYETTDSCLLLDGKAQEGRACLSETAQWVSVE